MSARILSPEEHCITDVPFYQPLGDEIEAFEAACQQKLPVILKGPTGCGRPDLSTIWPGGSCDH